MFENNKICQLFGIKYPIIQGGMTHLADAKLASTISEAGGLGVIGVDLMSPQWLEEEIRKIRELTKNPFGVNLFLRNPKIEELIKVVVSQHIPIVFTWGGNPLPYFFSFQAAGIKVIPIVPSPRLAKKMEDNGADAVSLQSFESFGFPGSHSLFSLISLTKKNLKNIPLIAFGGIYDGLSAKIAFLLGADGVQLETRFLVSLESSISQEYKNKIIESTHDDLQIVLEFTGFPFRVIKNQWSEKMKKLEERGAFPEEIKFEEISQLLDQKDIENSPLLVGASAPQIEEIKTCQEIISEIANYLKT